MTKPSQEIKGKTNRINNILQWAFFLNLLLTLIHGWLMLKTWWGRRVEVQLCGLSLIINRDVLLVCPCEWLASCPAGFIWSPECCTSKPGKMHSRNTVITRLTSLPCEPSLIHLHTIVFLFLLVLPSVTYSDQVFKWQRCLALCKMTMMKIASDICVCAFVSCLLPSDKP